MSYFIMSLRKLHNYLSMAYHFAFSHPSTFEIIDELDKLTPTDVAKTLIVENINNFIDKEKDSLLLKMNLFEIQENPIAVFSGIISETLLHNSLSPMYGIGAKLIFLTYKDIQKYYIIGFLYEHYIVKFNKMLKIIRSKTQDSQKYEVYVLLLTDFMIDLTSNMLNDLGLKTLLQNDLPPVNVQPSLYNPLTELKDYFCKSTKLIKSHNETITNLFLQNET